MRGRLGSTRGRILLAVTTLFALVTAFPLSLAFSLFGLDGMGVTARSLRGPVWWGGAEELEVHGIRLGTLDVFLDPFPLLLGQAKIDVARILHKPDDLVGSLTVGSGIHAVNGVTGSLPLAAVLAPLPVNSVEFEDFSVRFSGNLCASAQGRVRMRVPALIKGLNLANGLTGEARCEGNALVLPLASQSGEERLDLRVGADGGYDATMHIRTSDPAFATALGANGFRPVGGEQLLRATGKL